MKIKTLIFGLIIATLFIGCSREATTASYNISYEADNFKVLRRIVFFNGITDKYLLEIKGFCSIEYDKYDNQLEVTCKVGDNSYIKEYFGLSDNTAYFVEQLKEINVPAYYYKVNFRPQTIIPIVETKVTTQVPLPTIEVNSH